MNVGDTIRLVGWGDTYGDAGDAGEKRVVSAALRGFQSQWVMNYGTQSANTCQGDSGGPGFMMVNGQEDGTICEAGMCIPGEGGIGDPCDNNAECISGLCANVGGTQYCSDLCAVDTDDCPDNFACSDLGNGNGACVLSSADDDSTPTGGCSTTGGGGAPPLLLMLLAGLVLTRRRRVSSVR